MKYKDALENLANLPVSFVSMSDIASELGINCWQSSDEFEERVKKHWISHWVCTDEWVGVAVYTFDGEPVAFSHQTGRKNDELFSWISQDAANNLKNFIISFLEPDDLDIINLEEEISPAWFDRGR